MTLLGILFVVGVAFLATMNFEADMIATLKQRDRMVGGIDHATADVGSTLRDSMMASGVMPFGDSSKALTATAYAEMPGVQNSFSPIEPRWAATPGNDGLLGTSDDVPVLVFAGYFDAVGLQQRPFAGPSLPAGFVIDTSLPSDDQMVRQWTIVVGGTPPAPYTFPTDLRRCIDGPRKGDFCDASDPDACRPNPATDPLYLCEGPRVADADGDGIVDSILVDASDLGLAGTPLADLAGRVNPESNPTGKVRIALRVIPHGGLVNLNDSHPSLIENVLGLPTGTLAKPPDPNLGYFVHGPTRRQTLYSSLLDESFLRRRALLPPAVIPPSTLLGNVFDSIAQTAMGDMAWFLYPPQWPGGAAAGKYESVFNHRSSPMTWDEPFAGNPNFYLWPVRMEPFTAEAAWTPVAPWNMNPEYDRRHLVTTVSHDDLLARGGMISTPVGQKDLRQAMIVANQSAYDPNQCPPVLPFQFADYPPQLPNETDMRLVTDPRYESCEIDTNGVPVMCLTSPFCRVDPRKGRLQLSLPWIDDALADALAMSTAQAQNEAIERVYRTIHDAFFMLVRNAAAPLSVEGMACAVDDDCPVRDTVCLLQGVAPVSPNKGYCVHLGKLPAVRQIFTDPTDANGPGCKPTSPCSIPGSICNASRICELVAPAWRDETDGAKCRPDEIFLVTDPSTTPPTGLCIDRWTRQRRTEAMIARTAASLTANMIDFVDLECVGGPRDGGFCAVNTDCGGSPCQDLGLPTRVAIRHFDFVSKCQFGDRHNLPCNPADPNACPGGGFCPTTARPVGRDVDTVADTTDAATQGDQPLYVYGLERQPFITEVATFADGPTGNRTIVARAVELFNPYANPLTLTGEYVLVEAPAGAASLVGLPRIPLSGGLPINAPTTADGPFSTFITATTMPYRDQLIGTTSRSRLPIDLPVGAGGMTFENGWTIYLIRLAGGKEIIVDQFTVGGPSDFVGKQGPMLTGVPCGGGPPQPDCRFAVQRVVADPGAVVGTPLSAIWTATVPDVAEIVMGEADLGTWNRRPNPDLHPVEVQFANTGWFGPNIADPTAIAAFPTTGSLSLLIRQANRSTDDYLPPGGKVTNLAFTTALRVDPTVEDTAAMLVPTAPGSPTYVADTPAILREQQIDNARMPLFDVGVAGANTASGMLAAHHLPPQLLKRWDPAPNFPNPPPPAGTNGASTLRPLPGDLNMLPWGQLVFDYFTALPLSSAGPYLIPDNNNDGNPDYPIGAPESQPRVDQEGARVYGRINLNAAPWTVLSGLPFVPMNMIPAAFQQHVAGTLGVSPTDYALALSIGPELAQAIVAYREAAPIVFPDFTNTGNYDTGAPVAGIVGKPLYARGWNSPDPAVRRGTGFMSVGELANVRHTGATGSWDRVDSGVLGSDPDKNKNNENFINAAAVLIALGDWVTVRSQVFTIYGVVRGEADPDAAIGKVGAAAKAALVQDVDSRAIRFQETIDRLPTLFGEPAPRRIGDRTVSKLTDVNND